MTSCTPVRFEHFCSSSSSSSSISSSTDQRAEPACSMCSATNACWKDVWGGGSSAAASTRTLHAVVPDTYNIPSSATAASVLLRVSSETGVSKLAAGFGP
jgi:hypothetical protein